MAKSAEALAPSVQSRRLAVRRTLPPAQPGFLGPGHTAVELLGSDQLDASDPFVLLMDDRIDFAPGRKVGEAHPHAGLETVTLALEGSVIDEDEGPLHAGDLVWMTAGRGIVHSEHMRATGERTRVLQLWVTLPEAQRYVPPRLQILRSADVPVHREPGATVRVYSGSSHGLTAPTENYVPVTLLDVTLGAERSFVQELPSNYGGFLYPLEGKIHVGDDPRPLAVGELGWLDQLDQTPADTTTRLELRASGGPARVLLYAGQRQKEPTLHRGPFVAGSAADLAQMYAEYRAGHFARVSQL